MTAMRVPWGSINVSKMPSHDVASNISQAAPRYCLSNTTDLATSPLSESMEKSAAAATSSRVFRQGLTLVHFTAQR